MGTLVIGYMGTRLYGYMGTLGAWVHWFIGTLVNELKGKWRHEYMGSSNIGKVPYSLRHLSSFIERKNVGRSKIVLCVQF